MDSHRKDAVVIYIMYWQYFDFVRKFLAERLDFLKRHEKVNYGSSVSRTSDLINVFFTAVVFIVFTISCFYFFNVIYNVDAIVLYSFGGLIIVASLVCFTFAVWPYVNNLKFINKKTIIFVLIGIALIVGFLCFYIFYFKDFLKTHNFKFSLFVKKEKEQEEQYKECKTKDEYIRDYMANLKKTQQSFLDYVFLTQTKPA